MVEKCINKRWEQGIPHHPKSVEIVSGLAEVDWKYADDSLCLKFGGDGDNGEHLMYLFDIYFEMLDCNHKEGLVCL